MNHTPGALRAARMCAVHSIDMESSARHFAEIIDRETGARELLELVKAAFQWIDAVPMKTPLPTMPGIDRDWANSIISKAEGRA